MHVQRGDRVCGVGEGLDRFGVVGARVPEVYGGVGASCTNTNISQLSSRIGPSRGQREGLPETTTASPSPPNSTASILPPCPLHRLVVFPVSTSHRNTSLSPPTLAKRALSAATATSSTEYPCASYRWIGLVVSAVFAALLVLGTARERCTERSEEPVRRYVPG